MSNAKKIKDAMAAANYSGERDRERDRLQAIATSRMLVKNYWKVFGYDKRWSNVFKHVGKPVKNEMPGSQLETVMGANGFRRHGEWEAGSSAWPEQLQARAFLSATTMIRKARKAAKPVKSYRPLWDAIQANIMAANSAAGPVLGSSVKFIHSKGSSNATAPATIPLSPMWSRMVEQVGGPVLGARFLTRVEKVDEVGGFDLFQVQYYVAPAQNGPRWGYVAKLRGGTIRGFGDRPEVALQWTERQVVIHSTRKLTK